MSLLSLLWMPLGLMLNLVEKVLFLLIDAYDNYCYTPLQTTLSPLVARCPRYIDVNGRRFTIFTANIVSWSRTALVVPVAWCLKYDYTIVAFSLILFHDFLDHLDGIVAKVQKTVNGQIDDPLLGGFMDAFCDKIVNCLALWSILLLTDYTLMTSQQIMTYVLPCVVIIGYEAVLGVVRVQDYFRAYYNREYGKNTTQSPPNVAAVMEGKLKEKLESMGIAFLCLAQSNAVPSNTVACYAGITCLLLSVRLAHASLQHKLKARVDIQQENKELNEQEVMTKTKLDGDQKEGKNSIAVQVNFRPVYRRRQSAMDGYDSDIEETSEGEEEIEVIEDKLDLSEKEHMGSRPRTLSRSHSVPSWNPSMVVDRVFTVGCFDLFHEGHAKLLTRLKGLGRKIIDGVHDSRSIFKLKKRVPIDDTCKRMVNVKKYADVIIVGVHDSRSIFKLKKRVPIDDTCKRMINVKKYADVVFCISGTDPTPYLQCMYDHDEDQTCMYVRGDDMKNFPAREFTEKIMPVHFLPYTESVSSTKIRKEVYNASKFGPHVKHDDHIMFY